MHSASFNLARLREGLKPFRLHWFPRLGSTNVHAAAMRREGGLYAPAVVLAGRQTSGRGRGANTWFSTGGSLTVTFALPIADRIFPHQLPLIAGLAARNAAAELTGDNGVQLKWPNDLLYGGRKLGGLLCERIDKADLVGLGLNVNLDPADAPPHLKDRITSLAIIASRSIDLTDALICVARHLRLMVVGGAERPFAEVLREYDSHHALIGRKVSVSVNDGEPPLTGRVEGLDEMGRLLLRSRNTLHHIISGQVHHGY
ncbi:MAG TPA: biotin--[acetyl-CoA-carboxylase] ligase [Humisphaera sp.]|nr:biotin--[acetyl-CoA-carboxylase] ligase [Humisphaera sp.]